MPSDPRLSRRIQQVSEPLIDTLATRARALAARGADIANLGQALPGDRPPAAAMQAARKALANPATHVYSADAGIPELRAATAKWIARHDGYRVDPDSQLIVTAGGNQALMVALQCCVDAGDDVLVPSPYFMNHEMAVRLVDANSIEVPTRAENGWVITEGALFGGPEGPPPQVQGGPEGPRHTWTDVPRRAAGTQDVVASGRDRTPSVPAASEHVQVPSQRRGAVRGQDPPPADFAGIRAVVICTPNNPTGAVVPRVELDRVARACARRGAFLIVDRTYAGFEFERQPAPARLEPLPPNVIIVGSFSKVFSMTGWRVGYLAGSPELIEQALKAQDTMIICAPTIGQIAVAAALKARRGVVPAYLRELRRRRDYVQKRIAEIPGWTAVPAAGGFFTFVRVEGCTDSIRFAFSLLEEKHVLVLPGRIFGEAGEGHVRISYGVAGIVELREAFDRFADLKVRATEVREPKGSRHA